MHFAFVGQIEDLKKEKKKWWLFVFMCAYVCVVLNGSIFMYVP